MTTPADRLILPPEGAWIGQVWGATAAEARTTARQLEGAGYGVIWISEAYGREVLTFAAVLLAATESLVVATGIANMWGRDAMAMANGARTLAEAWPGRFVLGVGISHQPMVDRRGHGYARPLARSEAYLKAMRAAPFRAPQPDPAPPVLVGALGDRMIELAARLADGVHPYLVTPAHTARARGLMGPDALLAPEQAVVVCADPGPARAAARVHLTTYLSLDNYVRSLRRQGFSEADLRDGGSDHLVDSVVAWGSPEEIHGRIAAHRTAGADHVAVQPLAGDGVPAPLDQLLAIAAAR